MPTVHFSPYFEASLQNAEKIYGVEVSELVLKFALWKSHGINPLGMTDKSSAKDDEGRTFTPYARNQFRHVSFGIGSSGRNGNPVLAFRQIAGGDVVLVCITTKHEMFGLKKQFRKTFRKEFPKR